MLPRAQLKTLVTNMIAEKNIDAVEQKERTEQKTMVWRADESSMLSDTQIPVARNMIQRLETQYGAQFEAMGGTWDILGCGSRFTLQSQLPERTEPYTYTLVRTTLDGPWSLYYSGGLGTPETVALDSIPGLSTAVTELTQTFPGYAPEDIFTVFEDTPYTGGPRMNRYRLLPEAPKNAAHHLLQLFNSHQYSNPEWTLVKYIKSKIQSSEESKPVDADLIWQYKVMLALISEPRINPSTQTYYHPNTNPPVVVHNIPLAKLMALSAIAARDPNQVLRPQYQRRLNLIADPALRQKEKERLIESTFDTSFLFSGMYDIAREHSDDNPAGRANKTIHIPSCPGGSLGRSVFKFCPLNALSAMVTGTAQEVVTAAVHDSQTVIDDKSEYYDIPHEIENFIFHKLTQETNAIKVAVYRFMTSFMMDEINPPGAEANEDEKLQFNQFEKDKAAYIQFLKSLSTNSNKLELLAFVNNSVMHLNNPQLNNASEKIHIDKMLDLILLEMHPDTLLTKDFSAVIYPITEDRNAIDRLRKEGARVLQAKELSQTIYRDEEILSIRTQIKALSFRFKASQELIFNEITRGLLAFNTLKLPEQRDAWLRIKERINLKINFLEEQFNKEWEPQLNNFIRQLTPLLEKKSDPTADLFTQVARVVGYESIIGQAELSRIKEVATRTADNCKEISDKIHAALGVFTNIQMDVELLLSPVFHSNSRLQTARLAVIQEETIMINTHLNLATAFEWTHPDAWARAIAKQIPSNLKEAGRILRMMASFAPPINPEAVFFSLVKELNRQAISTEKFKDNLNLIKELISDFSASFYVNCILEIATAKDRSYAETASILNDFKETYINTNLKTPEQFNELSTEVAIGLSRKLQDPSATEFSWTQRNVAFISIITLFPANNLKHLSFCSSGQILDDAKTHWGNAYDETLHITGKSLVMAALQNKQFSAERPARIQTASKRSYSENYMLWITQGLKILETTSDATHKRIADRHDPKFVKLIDFVLLTFCKHLELSALRIIDKMYLENLCYFYLVVSASKPNTLLFAITEETSLHDRLHFLLTHLSTLVTTLTPVNDLYKLGFIRLVADPHLKYLSEFSASDDINAKRYIRASNSNPADLVFCGLDHKSLLSKNINAAEYKIDSIAPPLIHTPQIPTDVKQVKLQFLLTTPSHIATLTDKVAPESTLAPANLIRLMREQMKTESTKPAQGASATQTVPDTNLYSISQADPLLSSSSQNIDRMQDETEGMEGFLYKQLNLDSSQTTTVGAFTALKRSGQFGKEAKEREEKHFSSDEESPKAGKK